MLTAAAPAPFVTFTSIVSGRTTSTSAWILPDASTKIGTASPSSYAVGVISYLPSSGIPFGVAPKALLTVRTSSIVVLSLPARVIVRSPIFSCLTGNELL